MFYESQHSQKDGLIMLNITEDYSFPAHMHDSFELIWVAEGSMICEVDNIQYSLHSGDAVLIFPNQIHALITPQHAAMGICIFSRQLVKSFARSYTGQLPRNTLFRPDPYVTANLARAGSMTEVEQKGYFYLLCAQFIPTADFHIAEKDHSGLLHSIIQFVETNYTDDCSLDALSKSLGYHSVYLSRHFSELTGMHYTEYVNRHRISESVYLLKNTDASILDIAYSCGFRSLRSFNRNFKQTMGATPQSYRKSGFATA